MQKKNYNRNVSLQCATCGSTSAFVTDEKTGIIICKKCNRVYYGGYDELVILNEKRIADEFEDVKKEIGKDVQKELQNMLKKFK
jgi:ribosomal protein L37AE/L43A